MSKSLNKDIVRLIEERLEHGKKNYNQDVLDTDPRDWLDESLEEVLDSLVYIAAELLKIRDTKTKYLS